MAKKKLINTSGGDGYAYLTNDYNINKQSGNTPEPLIQSTTIGDPNKGLIVTPGKGEMVIPESDWDRYAEGFSGSSQEELNKYRTDTQSTISKINNTWLGGVVSGIGSFIADIGYMTDLDTYAAWIGDMDFDATKPLDLWNPAQSSSKLTERFGEGIKNWTNKNMPIYESQSDTILGQTFSWGSFKGMIDSITGFALAGAGAGKVVEGLAELGVKGLVELGQASKVAKGLESFEKLPSVVQKIENSTAKLSRTEAWVRLMKTKSPVFKVGTELTKDFATSILTKSAEARMEGLDAYQTDMQDMQPLIDANVLTYEAAKEKANKAANYAFDVTKWTFALDMLMVHQLFTTKVGLIEKEIANPNSALTKLKHLGKHALGVLKEGPEEMLQETAQMEGLNDIYKDIKDRLNNDQKQQFINQMGFDPDKTPTEYGERLAYFLNSTRSKVAGLAGIIQGPMQSALLGTFNRKQNKLQHAEEVKDYNKQQEIYKGNETLFNATQGFINKTKETVNSKRLQDLSIHMNDDELLDVAKEATLINIASENFANGTTEQLKKSIKQNGDSAESIKISNMLSKLESEFVQSKKYMNPTEVFVVQQNIKLQDKINKAFERKAKDTTLSKEERNSYTEALQNGFDKMNELTKGLDEITSRSYQLDLAQQAIDAEKLAATYGALPNIKSISEIDKLIKQHPDDENFKQQRQNLVNQESIKQTTPIKENTVKTKAKEKAQELTNKVTEVGKKIKDTLIPKGQKKNVDVVVDHSSVLTDSDIEKERIVNGTLKQTKKGVPVFDRDLNNKNLNAKFAEFNQQNNTNLSPSSEDYSTHYDKYDAGIDDIHPGEIKNFTDKIANEIYSTKYQNELSFSPTIVNEEVPKEVDNGISELFNLLDLDNQANNGEIHDDVPSLEEYKQLSDKTKRDMIISSFNNILDKAQQEDGVDLSKGTFKDLLSYFAKRNPELTKKHFNRLAGLYQMITGNRVKEETYEETLGLEKPDLYIDPEMPDVHQQNKAIDELHAREETWINPRVSSEELMAIYTDESIGTVGNKNELPASSFAFLSQDYFLRKIDKTTFKKEATGKVQVSPILNPNKFNPGEAIDFRIDKDYDDVITLNNGEKADWKLFLHEYNKDRDSWAKKYGIKKDESISDYIPLVISTERDGKVAYIHATNWINKLNVPSGIIENASSILRNFRRDLVDTLNKNDNTPVPSVVTEKAIGITKEGKPKGFVLNTTNRKLTSENLPDTNIKFAVKNIAGLKVNKFKSIQDNVLNIEYLPEFGSQMTYAFLPLGKQNNTMKYWAVPVLTEKLNPNITKTIRQALEIYTSQNEGVNPELYSSYKNSSEAIDLKTTSGLRSFLKKTIYLYDADKNGPIKDYINNKAAIGKLNTVVQVLEGGIDKVKIGRGELYTLTKGEPTNKESLDKIEKLLLGNMLFNVNGKNLNSDETFTYYSVNSENKIDKFEGKYNEFIKPYTTTFGTGIDLGTVNEKGEKEYGYTIQHVTRFNMNIEPVQQIEQQKEQNQSYQNNKDIVSLAQQLNKTYNEFYDIFLKDVDEGISTLEEALDLAKTAVIAEVNKEDKCE